MTRIPAYIIFLLCAVAVYSGSGTYALVRAEGGLRMRATPGLEGEKIAVVPDATVVEFIETRGSETLIAGVKGRWTRIKTENADGWVFGGFIVVDPAIESMMHTTSAIFMEIIEGDYERLMVRDPGGEKIVFWRFPDQELVESLKKGDRVEIRWYRYRLGMIEGGSSVVNYMGGIRRLE